MASQNNLFSTALVSDVCCSVSATHSIARRTCTSDESADGTRNTFFFDTSTPHNDTIVSEGSAIKPATGWVTLHATECLRSGLHEWSIRVEHQGDTSDGSGLMLGIVPRSFNRYDSFGSQGGGWCISRAGKFYGHWKRIDTNPISALAFGTGDHVVFELDVEAGRMSVRIADRQVIGEIQNMPPEVYPAVSLHYRHQHVVFEHHYIKERQGKKRGWFVSHALARISINMPFSRAHSDLCLAQLMALNKAVLSQVDSPLEHLLKARMMVLLRVLTSVQQNMESCLRLNQFLPLATTPEVLREQLNPAVLPPTAVQPLALACGIDILGVLLSKIEPTALTQTLGLLDQYLQGVTFGGLSEREHAKPTSVTPKIMENLKQMLLQLWSDNQSPRALSILIHLALARASLNDVLDVVRILFTVANTEIPLHAMVQRLIKEPHVTFDMPALLLSDCNKWETKRPDTFQVYAMTSDSHSLYACTNEGLTRIAIGSHGSPLRFQSFVPCPPDLGAIGVSCAVVSGLEHFLLASKTLLTKKGVLFLCYNKELRGYSEVPLSILGKEHALNNTLDIKVVSGLDRLYLVCGAEVSSAVAVRRDDKEVFPPSHVRASRPRSIPAEILTLDPSNHYSVLRRVQLHNVLPTLAPYLHPTDLRKCLLLNKDVYIDFGPPTPDLEFPGGCITIEMWMKLLGREEGKSLFVMGDRSISGEVFIELQTTDSGVCLKAGLRVETRTNSKSLTASAIFPPDCLHAWTHISVVFDYNWKIHINGCLCATSTTVQSSGMSGLVLEKPRKKMVLGMGCIGYLSEFRVWTGGRSTQDIQRDMYRTLSGEEVGLLCYCRLDDGTGHTIYDAASDHHGWVSRTLVPTWRFLSDFPFVPNTALATAAAIAEKTQTHFPLPSIHQAHFFTNGSQLGVLIPRVEEAANGKRNGVTLFFAIHTGEMLKREHVVSHQIEGPVCVGTLSNTLWFYLPGDRVVCWHSLMYTPSPEVESTDPTDVLPSPADGSSFDGAPTQGLPCTRHALLQSEEMQLDPKARTIPAGVLATHLILQCDMMASIYPDNGPIGFFANMAVDISFAFLQNLHRTVCEHYKEIGVGSSRRGSFLRGKKSPYIVAACLRILRLQLSVIRRSSVNPSTLNLTLVAAEGATEKTLGSRIYTTLCEIWNDLLVPPQLRNEAQRCVSTGISLFYPNVENKVDAILRLAGGNSSGRLAVPSSQIALQSLLQSLSISHNALTLVSTETKLPGPGHCVTPRLRDIMKLLLGISQDELLADLAHFKDSTHSTARLGQRTATAALSALQTAILAVALPPSLASPTTMTLETPFQVPDILLGQRESHLPVHETFLGYFEGLVETFCRACVTMCEFPKESRPVIETLIHESVLGVVLMQALNSLCFVITHAQVSRFLALLSKLLLAATELCNHLAPGTSASSITEAWLACEGGKAPAETSFLVLLRVSVAHVSAAVASYMTKPIPVSSDESSNKELFTLIESDLFAGGLLPNQHSIKTASMADIETYNITQQIASNVGVGKEMWDILRSGGHASSDSAVESVLRCLFAALLHFSPDIVYVIRRKLIQEPLVVKSLVSLEVESLHRKVESMRPEVITAQRDNGDACLTEMTARCNFLLNFLPTPDPSAQGDVLKSVFASSFEQASKSLNKETTNAWKGVYRGWQKVKKLQRLLHISKTNKVDMDSNLRQLHHFVFVSTVPLDELRNLLSRRRELGVLRAVGIESIRNLASQCSEIQCEIVGLFLRSLNQHHYLEGIRSCGLPICNSILHFMYTLLRDTLGKLSEPDTPIHFKFLLLTCLKAPWKSFDFAFLHSTKIITNLYDIWSHFSSSAGVFFIAKDEQALLRKSAWEAFFALALGCILCLDEEGTTLSYHFHSARFVKQAMQCICAEIQKCMTALEAAPSEDIVSYAYEVITLLSTLVKTIPSMAAWIPTCASTSEVVTTLGSIVMSSSSFIVSTELPRCAMFVLSALLPRVPVEAVDAATFGANRGLGVTNVVQFLLGAATGGFLCTEGEPLTHPIACDATRTLRELLKAGEKWAALVYSTLRLLVTTIPALNSTGIDPSGFKSLVVLRVLGGFVRAPGLYDHISRSTLNSGSCWDGLKQPGYVVDIKICSGTATVVSSGDNGLTTEEKDCTLDSIVTDQLEREVCKAELQFFPDLIEAVTGVLDNLKIESPPFEKSTTKALPHIVHSFHLMRALLKYMTNPNCAKQFAATTAPHKMYHALCALAPYSPLPLHLQDYHCSVILSAWMRQQGPKTGSPKGPTVSDTWMSDMAKKVERRHSSLHDHLGDVWESELQKLEGVARRNSQANAEETQSWQDKIRQGPPPDGLHYCLMFMNPMGRIEFNTPNLVADVPKGFSVEAIVCLSDSSHCVLWSSLVIPSRWDSAQFDYIVMSAWEEGSNNPKFGLRVSQHCISFGVFGKDEAVCDDVRSQEFERWVHLVGTYDGESWTVFKDGDTIATAPATTQFDPLMNYKWRMCGVPARTSEAFLAVAALRLWQHPIHRSHVQALSERAHSGDMSIPGSLNTRGSVFFPLCEGSSNTVTCENGIVDGTLSGLVVWAPTESIAVYPEEDLRTVDDIPQPEVGLEAIPWVQWIQETNATQRDHLSQSLCRHMSSACILLAREVILMMLKTLMSPHFHLLTGGPAIIPQVWPLDGNLPSALASMVRFRGPHIEMETLDIVKTYMERLLKAYALQGEREVSLFGYLFVQHCLLMLDEPEDTFTQEFVSPSIHSSEPVLTPLRLSGATQCKISFDCKCKNLDSLTIFSDSTQKAQIARCPDTQGAWSEVEIQSTGWMFIRRNCGTHALVTNGQRVSFRIRSPRFAVVVELLLHMIKLASTEIPQLVPIVCSSIPLCTLISAVHKEHGERRLQVASVVTALLQVWARNPKVNTHDQAPTYFILDRIFGMLVISYQKDHTQGIVSTSHSSLHSRFVQGLTELAVAGHIAESSWYGISLKSQAAHRFSIISNLYDSAMNKPVENTTPEVTLSAGQPHVTISDKRMGKWLCSSERQWQVIRCNAGVCRGRWYCEVRLPLGAVMSMGVVTSSFKGTEHAATCTLGQCVHSWGYDGGRLCRWHNGVRYEYGGRLKWKARDIIGLALDLEEGTLAYYHNGKYVGAAFTDLPVRRNVTFHAAISVNVGHGACELNFGKAPFAHDVPQSHLPFDREYFRLPPTLPIHRLHALVDISTAITSSQPLPPYFKALSDDHFASIKDIREGPDVVEISSFDGKPKLEGLTLYSQTLMCTARTNVRVSAGKWYYEVLIVTEGSMTVGWCDDAFRSDSNRGKGIGDDTHSWGFDGHRVAMRYNKQQTACSRRRWKEGDILGVLLDLDEHEMQFTLNGDLLRETSSDTHSTSFTLEAGGEWLSPAATLDPETAVTFIFNGNDLTYTPSNFNPIGYHFLMGAAIDDFYFGPDDDVSVSRTWPLMSTYLQDRSIVKAINKMCDDHSAHVNRLDIVNLLRFHGLSNNIVPSLRAIIPDEDAIYPLHRRIALLKHINNLLLSLLPFFNPKNEGPISQAILAMKHVLFASNTRTVLQKYLSASNGSGEPLKITINRRKTQSSSSSIQSCVFNQVFHMLGEKAPSLFWTSKRLWGVSLAGEGAEDVGGPYRESLSDMSHDLMSLTTPLFIPTPNQTQNDGEFRDRWIVNPKATEGTHLAMFTFLGRVMAGCVRSNEPLALYFPSLVWKRLVGDRITTEDLGLVDSALARSLQFVLEADKQGLDADSFANVYDGNFVTVRSDGVENELFPNGSQVTVTFHRRQEFVAFVQEHRVAVENKLQHQALLRGFHSVIPRHAYCLLRWEEMERVVCGRPDFDVNELMNHARFEGLAPDDVRVKNLRQILTEFGRHERALFMRYVTGRERLPQGIRLKIMPAPSRSSAESEDLYLPGASTCFYWITIPNYSTIDIMREKLLYAVQHCVDIDADFRVRDRDEEGLPQTSTVTEAPDDDDFEDYSHLL